MTQGDIGQSIVVERDMRREVLRHFLYLFRKD
jgi:hypothetical protein